MNTPTDLPPHPTGHVYLGRGGEFDTLPDDATFEGYAIRHKDPSDKWEFGKWVGHAAMTHFCAPADSEIVKLNQKDKQPAKEFIIWCSSRGDPTVKQPSLEAAETEAKRLAAKHPDRVFHICEIVASYVGEVTVKKI